LKACLFPTDAIECADVAPTGVVIRHRINDAIDLDYAGVVI
jgi:hypothetical protein